MASNTLQTSPLWSLIWAPRSLYFLTSLILCTFVSPKDCPPECAALWHEDNEQNIYTNLNLILYSVGIIDIMSMLGYEYSLSFQKSVCYHPLWFILLQCVCTYKEWPLEFCKCPLKFVSLCCVAVQLVIKTIRLIHLWNLRTTASTEILRII